MSRTHAVAKCFDAVDRGIRLAVIFSLLALSADGQGPAIKIVVQEGQGAINNIQQHRAKEPVIQVTDEDGAPIYQASVTFQVPDTGPGGAFADGNKMLTVQTDEKGMAVGRGLRPNSAEGQFEIRVTASFQGATASAAISEINAAEQPASGGGGGKTFLIIALIGGAAAGGLAAALGHGKSSSPSVGTISTPPPTILSPGTPSIQPPH